jgi:hypothetical protein
MAASWVTISDVFRDLGREAVPGHTWSVGAVVRDMWLIEFGRLPEKELRPKTNDGGTHMMAVYPPSWREKIVKAISAIETEAARQMDMFA